MPEKVKATADPFPHLRRPTFYADVGVTTNRPVTENAEEPAASEPTSIIVAESQARSTAQASGALAPVRKDVGQVRSVARQAAPRGSDQQISRDASADRKRGRPKIVEPRPWEAEGISRMTWYRRQKKG